jgi:hypothetical protein
VNRGFRVFLCRGCACHGSSNWCLTFMMPSNSSLVTFWMVPAARVTSAADRPARPRTRARAEGGATAIRRLEASEVGDWWGATAVVRATVAARACILFGAEFTFTRTRGCGIALGGLRSAWAVTSRIAPLGGKYRPFAALFLIQSIGAFSAPPAAMPARHAIIHFHR